MRSSCSNLKDKISATVTAKAVYYKRKIGLSLDIKVASLKNLAFVPCCGSNAPRFESLSRLALNRFRASQHVDWRRGKSAFIEENYFDTLANRRALLTTLPNQR